MTNDITNDGRWKQGQSGNPKGRPPNTRTLTEVLRAKGDESLVFGNEEIKGKDALAQAVWGLILTGEVWLSGRRLEVESVTEWASVVKWLYTHVDPRSRQEPEAEPVMEVRVVRVDKPIPPRRGQVEVGEGGVISTPPPDPLPKHGEGENEGMFERETVQSGDSEGSTKAETMLASLYPITEEA